MSTYVSENELNTREQVIKNEEHFIFSVIKRLNTCNIDDIIRLISQYAIGYIINCNIQGNCDNKIIIKNQFDFENNYNNYYNIDPKYIHSDNQHTISMIYGTYKRIFCISCNVNKKQCILCKNYDSELEICLNHPTCVVCNNQFIIINNKSINSCDENKCSICNGFTCSACDVESCCNKCILTQEYNDISNALKTAINNYSIQDFNVGIIETITLYSLGIIANCIIDDCNKDIIIVNKVDYIRKIRLTNMFKCYQSKLSKYNVTLITDVKQNNKSVFTYTKETRIFCISCIKSGHTDAFVGNTAEMLYEIIQSWYPKKAGNLTGMFVYNHDEFMILRYVNRKDRLKKKIDRLMQLLVSMSNNVINGYINTST
eukprot:327670_1